MGLKRSCFGPIYFYQIVNDQAGTHLAWYKTCAPMPPLRTVVSMNTVSQARLWLARILTPKTSQETNFRHAINVIGSPRSRAYQYMHRVVHRIIFAACGFLSLITAAPVFFSLNLAIKYDLLYILLSGILFVASFKTFKSALFLLRCIRDLVREHKNIAHILGNYGVENVVFGFRVRPDTPELILGIGKQILLISTVMGGMPMSRHLGSLSGNFSHTEMDLAGLLELNELSKELSEHLAAPVIPIYYMPQASFNGCTAYMQGDVVVSTRHGLEFICGNEPTYPVNAKTSQLIESLKTTKIKSEMPKFALSAHGLFGYLKYFAPTFDRVSAIFSCLFKYPKWMPQS